MMDIRRVVRCRGCGAHFSAPADAVFDNGAPELGLELRCPVCCVLDRYDGSDVLMSEPTSEMT